jgi:hypothetical protein
MIKKIYIFFHPLVGLDHDLHQFLGVENLSFGYILFLFYYYIYIQYFEKINYYYRSMSVFSRCIMEISA